MVNNRVATRFGERAQPPNPIETDGLSAKEVAAWTCILLGMILLPLVLFPYPGLQDYPNHLARGLILLNPNDPVLERLYRVKWDLLPDLGWDIWIKIVGQVIPLGLAGKLFIAIAQVLILGGCFVLNRALVSRFTYAPLLAAPLLFNAGFTRGFLSFTLGTGLALLASAWWVSARRKNWLGRLFLATIISTGLYFVHFYAWAFYGLFVLCFEVQKRVESRETNFAMWALQLGRDGLQALPVPFMIAHTAANSAPPEFLARRFELPYARFLQIQHLIDVGNPATSFALVVTFSAFIAIALRKLVWLRVTTECALLLAVSVALFFLLPDQIAGTYYVSWRILLLGSLVGIASLVPIEGHEMGPRSGLLIIACIIAFISTQTIWSWRSAEAGREAFAQLIQDVPEGKAIFVVHSGTTARKLERSSVGLFHVGSYAVLTRRALVQSMFTATGQHPLRFRDQQLQSIPKNSEMFLSEIKKEFRKDGLDLADHIMGFDFVVVHGPDFGDDLLALSQQKLLLINQTKDFRLYKVEK
jgi:hypothetical protein